MMRVLILIDTENFTRSISKVCKERKQNRYIDWHKINSFVLDYLGKNRQYEKENLIHTRTYYYNGEITDKLLKKIKNAGVDEHIEKAQRIKSKSEIFSKHTKDFYFFEVKSKPLHYSKEKGLFQKGIDVELAVDLVKWGFGDCYDVVALFSGDVDLLESVKTIKDLGKHVITFSCDGVMAHDLKSNVDMFVDFSKLSDEYLDLFSHIFVKRT